MPPLSGAAGRPLRRPPALSAPLRDHPSTPTISQVIWRPSRSGIGEGEGPKPGKTPSQNKVSAGSSSRSVNQLQYGPNRPRRMFSCKSAAEKVSLRPRPRKRPYRYFRQVIASGRARPSLVRQMLVGGRPCANYRRIPAFQFIRSFFPPGLSGGFTPLPSTARLRSSPPLRSAHCRVHPFCNWLER